MQSDKKHIYVVGLDDFNKKELEKIRENSDYAHCEFHPLLSYDDLGQTQEVSFDNLLDKARKILDEADTPVDGIMTFWDFPAQTLVPLLCKEKGLPCASLTALEKCEHKYWARQLQKEHVPEATPAFAAVNPFADDDSPPDLHYPFWLKPIKSYSSYLAFKIKDEEGYRRAIREVREKIDKLANPYNELLEHMDLPDEIAKIDGRWCIAEEVISGEQCTVEGYCHDSRFHAHGIIDSIDEKGASSFARYQYPSHLPDEVQERLVDICKRLFEGIGFSQGAVNVEFFYNTENGDLKILEVNPRISQSHSELFKMVDGVSNEVIPVALSLGEAPKFPHREGEEKLAGKFFLRAHQDAYVSKVPDSANIRKIKKEFPDIEIKIKAKEGGRLSDEELQDSYSFELAQLYIGGDDEEELLSEYHQCVEMMEFKLEDTDENLSQLTREKYQPHSRGQNSEIRDQR